MRFSRCAAQFCMCCGLKWKTCDCPWFSYTPDGPDVLNDMRIPLRPRAYTEELSSRRHQERGDERLARRLSGLPSHNPSTEFGLDYQGGIGELETHGNGGDHFMNESYVRTAHNILGMGMEQANAAANYVLGVRSDRQGGAPRISTNDRYPTIGLPRVNLPQQEVPSPLQRQASVRRGGMGGEVPIRRISLRGRPKVERSPVGLPAMEGRSTIVVVDEEGESVRRSILAGLNARGSGGSGRVDAWRAHVGAGVIPKEGVFSVV